MKHKKVKASLLTIATTLTLVLTGCADNSGKIPLDQARAAQEIIPIQQAKILQRQFISNRAELGKLVTDTSFLSKKFNLPNAEAFNRDAIALLLNQSGADGIRIYYGADENGKIRLILLPVDKAGKDILANLDGKPAAIVIPGVSSAQAFGEDDDAVETGQICPPCVIEGQ